MSEVVLQLGPVTFSAFEIPAGINFGGRQIIAIHQLADGRRVIDSIGAAESELSFSGAFSGPTATFRARQLDSLRVAGAELSLTWDVFCYTVVVNRFDAEYKSSAWIPYRLLCTVLRDDAAPVLPVAPSLGTTVLSDLTVAAAQCSDVGVDFTEVQAALAVPGAFTLGSDAYTAARATIATTQSAILFQMTSVETTLTSVLLSYVASPEPLASNLQSVVVAAQQLANLTYGNSYVARAARNLQNASS